MVRRLLVSLGLFLALAIPVGAQLQPATYESPSGLWRLHVDPIERSGTSSADYSMTFDGTAVWEARHPFTLWEACVTDEGRVGGYGYVGAEPWTPDGGSVDVAVLAPDGTVLARDRHAREFSRYLDFSGVPRPLGILHHPVLDRMIVRTRNENIAPGAEAWWTYDLRTGACLSRVRPQDATEPGVESHGVAAVAVEAPQARLAAPIRAEPMREVPLEGAFLRSPRRCWIDSTFGRVLVLDDSDHTLHVFDGDGRRVLVGETDPDDVQGLRICQRAGCDASGGAWASRNWKRTEYLHFLPEGTRAGSVFLDGTIDFCPDGDTRWGVRDHRLVRRGGGRDSMDLDRTPEGRWWREIVDLAVASDSRLAVLDAASLDLRTSHQPLLVARYDAEGVPLGCLELPPSIRPGHLAIAGPWILLPSYGFPAWLLDTRDGALHPLEAPDDAEDVRLGLSPDGRELWAVELVTRTLRRFALP